RRSFAATRLGLRKKTRPGRPVRGARYRACNNPDAQRGIAASDSEIHWPKRVSSHRGNDRKSDFVCARWRRHCGAASFGTALWSRQLGWDSGDAAQTMRGTPNSVFGEGSWMASSHDPMPVRTNSRWILSARHSGRKIFKNGARHWYTFTP